MVALECNKQCNMEWIGCVHEYVAAVVRSMAACESGTFCFWLLVPTTILISVHCFGVALFLLCMYTTFEYLVGVVCLHKCYNFREIQCMETVAHAQAVYTRPCLFPPTRPGYEAITTHDVI